MGILIKGMDEIPEDGAVLVVKHDNGKAYIKHACTYGYSMELVKLPAVHPDHVADISKKVEGDCISRRAAIDAIMGQPPEPHYPSWYAAQIEKLPAAQPAINCSEIPNGSDDTISRQAVTKFLNDWLSCLFENCHKQSASDLKMIIKDFKNMPSAQPERNGKWIYNSPTTMKCDRCGFAIKDWDWHRFKYCPNCGADMRGGGAE